MHLCSCRRGFEISPAEVECEDLRRGRSEGRRRLVTSSRTEINMLYISIIWLLFPGIKRFHSILSKKAGKFGIILNLN